MYMYILLLSSLAVGTEPIGQVRQAAGSPGKGSDDESDDDDRNRRKDKRRKRKKRRRDEKDRHDKHDKVRHKVSTHENVITKYQKSQFCLKKKLRSVDIMNLSVYVFRRKERNPLNM